MVWCEEGWEKKEVRKAALVYPDGRHTPFSLYLYCRQELDYKQCRLNPKSRSSEDNANNY